MPCLKEIPVLLQVTQQLAPRGVALIGVAMDEPQSLQAQVEPFRLKFFPTFTTWLREESDMDSIASVVDAAWNEILPTTYIIGRNGKLRTKIQGVRSAEQFRASIEAALQAGQ
jgi:peroxiredoxin